MSAPVAEKKPTTFLGVAGSALWAVVKHVPARAVLWAFIGLVVSGVAVALSFVIALFVMERGALLLGYLVAIPIAIPFLGAAVFFVHGLQRGAARAALALEEKFGLVRYLVDKILARVAARFGGTAASLPLADLEAGLKESVNEYFGSEDALEGSGMGGWVLRRAKKSVVARIETYTLAAYRDAEGGASGVSIEKLSPRVSAEMSKGLATIVMKPVNGQLKILMLITIAVGLGWWAILFGLVSLIAHD
jgi:hypothetical protein